MNIQEHGLIEPVELLSAAAFTKNKLIQSRDTFKMPLMSVLQRLFVDCLKFK